MTAKANPHWYPRHYKDYQLDTSHLSMLEHGAYTLLLDHYYLTGKPLLADIRAVARQMRCMLPEEVEAVKSVLEQFFTLQADGWHNKRADEELSRRSELIVKRQAVGKRGAESRWQTDSNCHSNSHSNEDGNWHSNWDGKGDGKPMHKHKHNIQTQVQEQIQEQPEVQKPVKPKNLPAPLVADATGSQVWNAYEHAYVLRYGIEPVRNAKNNALCKQLIARLGVDAPEVAAFFVAHSQQFYVLKGHPLNLLVADAEKLRTEWATGQKITTVAARQADRTQATGQVFAALIAEQGGQ
jgi:uncharacterized protein YdaU (DUF1376 family)